MVTKSLMTLGEILLAAKKITQEELDKALEDQKYTGKKLGKILVEVGVLEEQEVFEFLALHLKTPLIDLANMKIDQDLIQLLPEKMIRKYHVLPIFKKLPPITLLDCSKHCRRIATCYGMTIWKSCSVC